MKFGVVEQPEFFIESWATREIGIKRTPRTLESNTEVNPKEIVNAFLVRYTEEVSNNEMMVFVPEKISKK